MQAHNENGNVTTRNTYEIIIKILLQISLSPET